MHESEFSESVARTQHSSLDFLNEDFHRPFEQDIEVSARVALAKNMGVGLELAPKHFIYDPVRGGLGQTAQQVVAAENCTQHQSLRIRHEFIQEARVFRTQLAVEMRLVRHFLRSFALLH